ncbi:MAG: transketolase family protein [Acidobacteriota bacterium]
MEMLGTRDVYGKTLVELGRENENIVVLDADLASSTRTSYFAREFPHRFFNMGVSEQDLIGTAAGLALAGKLPFVSSFAIFLAGKAWEQIRQSICIPNLNVKLVATHGGITVGEDGASHHSTEDFALMRVLPNMKVICPADGVETEKVIREIVKHRGPIYVRLARPKFPVVLDHTYQFKVGRSFTLREGKDLTMIAIGIMVYHCLRATEELDKEGISAAVVNMSTLKPIDAPAIARAVSQTGAILTAEEHSVIGGLGSAVAEVVSQNCPAPMKIIGVDDLFGVSGNADKLMEHFHLTYPYIVEGARQLLKRK